MATQADDPIQKLTSHYCYWLRLCKAVAWMRQLADWIRSKKCQTGYLQAPELQAVKHVECSALQWLQRQIGKAFQPTRGFTHGGSLGKAKTDSSKWAEKHCILQIGDVVLIADHTLPRGCWPLGRVTDVFPDRKGLVRSVQLRAGQSGVLVRPVHKLCLLEGRE